MAVGFQEKPWRVRLYKRALQPDGRVADVELEPFEDVKPRCPADQIVDARGRLACVTASGKEVMSGGGGGGGTTARELSSLALLALAVLSLGTVRRWHHRRRNSIAA